MRYILICSNLLTKAISINFIDIGLVLYESLFNLSVTVIRKLGASISTQLHVLKVTVVKIVYVFQRDCNKRNILTYTEVY